MPTTMEALLSCSNELLKPELFDDYCPNGLQIQGKNTVQRLVCGVTASQALIDRAIAAQADVVLVHHGFFWKGENPCITGIKRRRIEALLRHDINLLAYHLPLDAHPRLGNNACLAERLGIDISGGLDGDGPGSVGNIGRLQQPLSARQFCSRVADALGREPLLIAAGEHPISTIGWCSGAAQGYIDRAAALGVDAYLSGEVSEPTVHSARELGVHYIAAGHHATERYGVQAVGQYLAQALDLDYQFIDVDNPV